MTTSFMQIHERPGLAARGVAGLEYQDAPGGNHPSAPGHPAGGCPVLVRATAASARPSAVRTAKVPPGQLTLRLQKGSSKRYWQLPDKSMKHGAVSDAKQTET
jgi:hypothetical protein